MGFGYSPPGGGGGGGSSDHATLSNRTTADQHTTAAITGLDTTLATINKTEYEVLLTNTSISAPGAYLLNTNVNVTLPSAAANLGKHLFIQTLASSSSTITPFSGESWQSSPGLDGVRTTPLAVTTPILYHWVAVGTADFGVNIWALLVATDGSASSGAAADPITTILARQNLI